MIENNYNIINDYNIIFVKSKRYYKVDLSTRAFDFEHTSPYLLKADSFEIKESSWNNMIVKLAKFLNTNSPKDRNELLSIQNDWGKQAVFSVEQKSNYREFDYGLFINVNHTSVHAVWTIQLLLEEWGINLCKCELLIHRAPKAEASDVINHFTTNTIKNFKGFLQFTTSYDVAAIEKLIGILKKINDTMCPKVFLRSGYNNIWVLDEYVYFDKMKNELLEYIRKIYFEKPIAKKNCEKALTLLGRYYKKTLR